MSVIQQGSVLRPILSYIYLNYLFHLVEKTNLKLCGRQQDISSTFERFEFHFVKSNNPKVSSNFFWHQIRSSVDSKCKTWASKSQKFLVIAIDRHL